MKATISTLLLWACLVTGSTVPTAAATRPWDRPDRALARANTNNPSAAELIAQLRSRHAEAQLELKQFTAAQTGSTNLPTGATTADVIEYSLLLQALVRAYEREIDDTATFEKLAQRQRDLTETAEAWSGFSEPPPYSLLLVDNLRDSIASLSTSIEVAETTRDMFEKLTADTRDLLSQSDSRLRSLTEEFESETDVAHKAHLSWLKTFELARNRLATANAAGYERRRQRMAAEAIENRQRQELVRRQLVSIGQQVRFSAADLEKILANLDRRRRELDAQYETAQGAREAEETKLAAARDGLHAALAAPSPVGTNVAGWQQLVAVRTLQAETAGQRVVLTRQLTDLAMYERALWQTRFATFGSTDYAALQRGYQRLLTIQRFLQTAKPYFGLQLELAARQISEEQQALQNRPEALGEPGLGRERLESYAEREALFRDGLRSLERAERLVSRWKESLDEDRRALPLAGRIRDLFTGFSSFAEKLWNFELLVAEDTITVDGQRITGRRSVTTGKIVKAVLILAVGYWLASLFGRLLERVAVRRLNVEKNQANLVRRWTRVVLVLALILLSLVWVKIPLTVFAFLGGALAIGLGFGMQTLLKNFISGIIILFERPFRVGDVLDVAGRCGTVTSIGIRSSILQIGDGTETLIPNSTLLEANLTNWTYSNRIVRSTLTVVVASDSDTRRVSQLLAEAADRHGLILKHPPREVYFKGFEENGFAFELQYWLDVHKHNSAQIASDLRHMLAVAFSEHGIDLSFPQRELHFDPRRPLRMEMLPPHDAAPDHRLERP